MASSNTSDISSQIVEKAKSLGASLAGIASVDLLKRSPSHYIYSRIEQNKGVGSRELAEGINPGEIREVSGNNEPVQFIEYCRRCDLACPVGK